MASFTDGQILEQRYKIVRLLGEGGYGAVYLASDLLSGNHVALKESFEKSQGAIEQFELEASLLARLGHRGLPRVTDYRIIPPGCPVLVMDFIEGLDLDIYVEQQGGVLNEPDAARIMLQVCETVAYLHTRRPDRIVHRDIKPPNIKVTTDGKAMLVDFGIAKLAKKGTKKIAKAVTPHFSPWEQYSQTTDERSDVYALGATYFFLLTGNFPTDSKERKVEGTSVIPPRSIVQSISQPIEALIMKCLEMDPDNRYQNANRMYAALKQITGIVVAPFATGQAPVARCPRCGHINRPSARFCVRDGTPLACTQVTGIDLMPPRAGVLTPDLSTPPTTKPSPGQVDQSQPAEALLKIATQFALNQEYARAIPYFEAVYHKGVTEAVLFFNLGLCYYLTDDYTSALRVFQEGFSRHSQDADLAFQLARSFYNMQNFTQALHFANRACKLDPQDTHNMCLYASCLMALDRNSAAIPKLKQILKIDPNNEPAYLMLGQIYLENKDYYLAQRHFEEACRVAPPNADCHALLGLSLACQNRRQEASQELCLALSLDPGHLKAQEWLKAVSGF